MLLWSLFFKELLKIKKHILMESMKQQESPAQSRPFVSFPSALGQKTLPRTFLSPPQLRLATRWRGEALHGSWKSEKGKCSIGKDPVTARLSYTAGSPDIARSLLDGFRLGKMVNQVFFFTKHP